MQVSFEAPEDSQYNWAQGKVHDIAYLGSHSVYYIRLSSGQLIQSQYTNIERRGERPTWGDDVYVWWESASAMVLRS